MDYLASKRKARKDYLGDGIKSFDADNQIAVNLSWFKHSPWTLMTDPVYERAIHEVDFAKKHSNNKN